MVIAARLETRRKNREKRFCLLVIHKSIVNALLTHDKSRAIVLIKADISVGLLETYRNSGKISGYGVFIELAYHVSQNKT